eukprot:2340012-Rhodomonas_salina.1
MVYSSLKVFDFGSPVASALEAKAQICRNLISLLEIELEVESHFALFFGCAGRQYPKSRGTSGTRKRFKKEQYWTLLVLSASTTGNRWMVQSSAILSVGLPTT